MKKILIVGASGFIGKNISGYLQNTTERYELYTPDSIELNCADAVAVEKYLKKYQFDVVIHAVGHSNIPGKNRVPKDTLDMTLRTYFNFERCQEHYKKMVYFGSGAEFDREHYEPKMNETDFDRFVPKDDYGYAKYIINKSIKNSKNIYNFRIFGLFGKYEYWPNKFISLSCCKTIFDVPISIRRDVRFDWLYIDDLMSIIHWFINNEPKYKDYNVCSGSVYGLFEVAQKIIDVEGKNLPIYVCSDEEAFEYSGCNNRLLEEIGDFQFTNMDEAVRVLYHWYKKSKEAIDISNIFYLNDKL